MKKILTILIELIMIILLVWIVASYIDVAAHNTDPNPVYHAWNLFEIIFG